MIDKIYYDPSDGFLWGTDAKGNKEKVKTDAVVALMPQNVSLSEDGCLLIDDLRNKPHTLLGPDGKPKSLIGPRGANGVPGKDGKDGHDVVCHYEVGDSWKSVQILKDVTPGAYTIYGLVEPDKTAAYPFNSACILLGEFEDMTENSLKDSLKEFGTEFTVDEPVNIYVVFAEADHILAAKDLENVEGGEEQLKHVEANCTITVKNIYLCAKGAKGEAGETGPQGEAGQSVQIEEKTYVNGTTVIRFSDGTEIEITDGNKYVQTNTVDSDLQQNYLQILERYTQFAPGDFTISTDSGTIWVYSGLNLGFVKGPSLKGSNGATGANGKDGWGYLIKGQVNDLGDLESRIGEGKPGDMYQDINTGALYIWSEADDHWATVTNVQGPKGDKGDQGTKFIVPTNQFTDDNINNLELWDDDLPQIALQDGDCTISVDTKTLWSWSEDGGGFTKLFTLKGDTGDNGLTPFIGENGDWWIGTEDTGVQAEGKDGENPFTEEEVQTLKELPDNLIDLETRLAALEQALQNIDLSGLSVAYPIQVEE